MVILPRQTFIWNILPVYLKEAKLHIELVRTQPFEDGNKRTARIITNYNLVKQNRAPIIIEKEELDEYWNYINNYDVEGFTNFLKNKSQKEKGTTVTITLPCN